MTGWSGGGALVAAGRRPIEDVVHEVGVVFQLIQLIFALLVHLPPEPFQQRRALRGILACRSRVCLIESMTLSDREGQRERAHFAGYLKPIFGCLRRNRRGVFAAVLTRYLKPVYAAEPVGTGDWTRRQIPGAHHGK